MEIDKSMITNLLRERGNQAQADEAESQLPDKVDPQAQSGLLSKFGVDPQELLSKFGGEGGIGGFLGDVSKKF